MKRSFPNKAPCKPKAEDEFDYLDESSDTELDTLIEQELDNISA